MPCHWRRPYHMVQINLTTCRTQRVPPDRPLSSQTTSVLECTTKAENRVDGVGTRARIDIRDLNMAGLPSLTREGDNRRVVAVAKHLCGAATDLALRRVVLSRTPSTRIFFLNCFVWFFGGAGGWVHVLFFEGMAFVCCCGGWSVLVGIIAR